MERNLSNASDSYIVQNYLSDFLSECGALPIGAYDAQDLDGPLSCPNSPTSPMMSSPTFLHISFKLEGYRQRPVRSTRGRTATSSGA